MAVRKRIEIYSAACGCCREAEALIRRVAGADHDIEVLDMFHAGVFNRAARYGIKSVPAVVVDGQLVDRVIDEEAIRSVLG